MSGPTVFTDLNAAGWGSGTNVTVTLTTGTSALVFFGARRVSVDAAGATLEMSYRVSGATTIAAANNFGTVDESGAASDFNSVGRAHFVTGLTGGSNTFTVQALISSGSDTGVIARPYIAVMAL